MYNRSSSRGLESSTRHTLQNKTNVKSNPHALSRVYTQIEPVHVNLYMYNLFLANMKNSKCTEEIQTFKSTMYSPEYKTTTTLYDQKTHVRKTRMEAESLEKTRVSRITKTNMTEINPSHFDRAKIVYSTAQRNIYMLKDHTVVLTLYKNKSLYSYTIKSCCDTLRPPSSAFELFDSLILKCTLAAPIIKAYNNMFASHLEKKSYVDKSVPYTDHFTPKNIYTSSTTMVPFFDLYTTQPKIRNSTTCFLFFNNNHCYLIDSGRVELYSYVIGELNSTVVVGELESGLFWTTDVLFYKGEDYTDKTFTERIQCKSELEMSIMHLEGKTKICFVPVFLTQDACVKENLNVSLHSIVVKNTLAECIDAASEWSGPCDKGVIFKALYLPFYSKDIYKWKPAELSSFDLKVFFVCEYKSGQANMQVYRLYASGTTDVYPIEGFYGTPETPHKGYIKINSDQLYQTFGINSIPSETIVEFICKNINGKNRLVPVRIRKDKTKPNFIVLANQVWSHCANPLTLNMLKDLASHTLDSFKSDVYNSEMAEFYLNKTCDSSIFTLMNEYLFSSYVLQSLGQQAIDSVKNCRVYNKTPNPTSLALYKFFV